MSSEFEYPDLSELTPDHTKRANAFIVAVEALSNEQCNVFAINDTEMLLDTITADVGLGIPSDQNREILETLTPEEHLLIDVFDDFITDTLNPFGDEADIESGKATRVSVQVHSNEDSNIISVLKTIQEFAESNIIRGKVIERNPIVDNPLIADYRKIGEDTSYLHYRYCEVVYEFSDVDN